MRFARVTSLIALVLAGISAYAQPKVNPGTQITWPANCVETNMVYSPAARACVALIPGSTAITGTSPFVDIRFWGALTNGVHDDTAAVNQSLSIGASFGFPVYFPAGSAKVTSGLVIPSNVQIQGATRQTSIIKLSSPSGMAIALSLSAVSNIQISHVTLQADQSAATGVKQLVTLNKASNVVFDDVAFQNGGFAAAYSNPASNLYVQESTNVTVRNSVFSGGGGVYNVVVDYNTPAGYNPTHNLMFDHNLVMNNNEWFGVATFNLQQSQITNNYINENNKGGADNQSGYGILTYMTHGATLSTSGASVNGTDTLTITLAANQLPTPVTGNYVIHLTGVSGCTGTQPNGYFTATALTGTTGQFTSTGSTCSSASLAGATIEALTIPDGNRIAGNIVTNTAGTGIYNQSGNHTVIAENILSNCDQVMQYVSLTTGCITTVGGGYAPGFGGLGNTIIGNTVSGSGQGGIGIGHGMHFAGTTNLVVANNTIDGTKGIALRFENTVNTRASENVVYGGTYGYYLYNGNINGSFSGTIHNPTLGGFAELSTSAANTDTKLSGKVTMAGGQCAVIQGTRTVTDLECIGAYVYVAGTNANVKAKVTNETVDNQALQFSSAVSPTVTLNVDGAKGGVTLAGQSQNVVVQNSTFKNMTGAAFADPGPTTISGTFTTGSPNVTVVNCNGLVLGVILADYATNGWLTPGTTVSSCTGTTLVMSANANGTGAENINVFSHYIDGLTWQNNEIYGLNPAGTDPFISFAEQHFKINGGYVTGYFQNGGQFHFVGVTGVLGGINKVSNVSIKGSTTGTNSCVSAADETANLYVENNTCDTVSSAGGYGFIDQGVSAANPLNGKNYWLYNDSNAAADLMTNGQQVYNTPTFVGLTLTGLSDGPVTSTSGVLGSKSYVDSSWSPYTWTAIAVASMGQMTHAAALTVTRVEMVMATNAAGCTTYPIIALYDQTSSTALQSFTVAAGTQVYDSGALSLAVAANHVLRVRVTTAAAGCTTNPVMGSFTTLYH